VRVQFLAHGLAHGFTLTSESSPAVDIQKRHSKAMKKILSNKITMVPRL
jgi:hypothetical protein